MYAKKSYIFSEIKIEKLPLVIKKEDFNKMTSYAEVESLSRNKARNIINKAKSEARLIVIRSEKEKQADIKRGYEKGMADAKKEMASTMTELASTSARFMKDIESRIVDIVCGSVSDIVSAFDDEALVTEVVRKSANNFKSGDSVTLWVAPKIHARFDLGISDLVAPASLAIKADERLHGAQCRLDNGYMVLDGDSSVQIAALRTALKRKLTVKEILN